MHRIATSVNHLIREDMHASWVKYNADTHFPLQNLPYGVFRRSPDARPAVGVAIGDLILDLAAAAHNGLFERTELAVSEGISRNNGTLLFDPVFCFDAPALNNFMGTGRPAWTQARRLISKRYCCVFSFSNSFLRSADMLSAGNPLIRDSVCA
jgi:hypothetical protein